MTPLKKKFNRAYAKELIEISLGDLKTAKVLLDHSGGRPENFFFMVQQSAEKALKAVLCHCDLAVPMIHDLGALITMLPDNVSSPSQKELLALTEFASIRRYEQGLYDYSLEEMRATYQAVEKVIQWARGLISNS